jgi:2-oxoglutarate ferredoxin oxidoreductase subunit gamma
MRQEIVLSGAGGQGLILAGTILAEAAGTFEGKEVVQTQSYGIQARGGASQSTIIISDRPIKFPEVLAPHILLCLSQEAYDRYAPRLREDGLLIIDRDLVNTLGNSTHLKVMAFPFTAEAERIGRRIAANVLALGTLATVSGVVKPESLAKAIPSRLPERNVATALDALNIGVNLPKAAEALGP